jgi:predicted Ser/Thr protein kinase
MSATRKRPARLPLAGLKTESQTRVQELGKGSFGTVYLTEGRRDKKPYVVKVRRDWPTRGAAACGRERRARTFGSAL